MFNLSVGCSPVKKADDTAFDTKLLGTRTNVQKEDLSKVKIYSSIGSQQSIQKAVSNSKQKAKKSEPEDIWAGSMEGLFS